MSATLYDEALTAVAAAAGARFPGAAVAQAAFELEPEDLFGDPDSWPALTVPAVAVFDGTIVPPEPRARGPIADLQSYQEGAAEVVAWVRGSSLADLTTRARETRRDLIQLINEVAIANPFSSHQWSVEWTLAATKVSRTNVGFYAAVRVGFRVLLDE